MSTTPPVVVTSNQPHGYTNGHTSQNLSDAQSPHVSPPAGPTASSPYTTATMAPIAPQPSAAATETPGTPGSMGPPSRPPDRPAKEYEYEPTDMLAGTGIDLRAEEQLAADMLLSGYEASYGFPQFPPGSKDSFHGAGPMNQASGRLEAQSQNELAAIAAQKAWDAAAKRLAATRAQELNEPYIAAAAVHGKLEKFAKEQGLDLHLEHKNPQNAPGRLRVADEQPAPRLEVVTKTLPDATVVTTTGSFIPHETYLADQLALLSIACKQRMRALVEDAYRVSKNRQESSHGLVPEEWVEAAAPLPGMAAVEEEAAAAAAAASGEATDPNANSRKRSQSAANLDPVNGVPVKLHKIEKNETISTIRDVTRAERDWEESRLRRRNIRTDGGGKDSATPSRAGSVAPGTPGAASGDTTSKKDASKKEQRKTAMAKAAEATNHISQNLTSSMFVGKTGGLFGKKKYDWMNPKPKSGGSTPARAGTPGASGGGGGAAGGGTAQAENIPLTTESRTRLGNWREDKEKGRGIQLRDWVAALEAEGVDGTVLQKAYDKLDTSGPR
ncbi:related to tpa inducible protein [Cephalotrichum gorgonifer]|uniref:Transcription initiation factor TFIID subunit 4 n=1 Tax=Cephalotrichum gorgonifer TaxID=2041049 RepID=A0AAE8N4W3_9PEZI|nr:related to tpa inducible protein [Cephalotrichum gorgonifer]